LGTVVARFKGVRFKGILYLRVDFPGTKFVPSINTTKTLILFKGGNQSAIPLYRIFSLYLIGGKKKLYLIWGIFIFLFYKKKKKKIFLMISI
jgi:hypothetical protein